MEQILREILEELRTLNATIAGQVEANLAASEKAKEHLENLRSQLPPHLQSLLGEAN